VVREYPSRAWSILALEGSQGRATCASLILIVPVVLAAFASHPIQKLNPPVYQEDSPYQQVRVRDDQLFRYLVLDRTFHRGHVESGPVAAVSPL